METKQFPLRVVLTVTTGRLLTERKGERDNGIGDLYELLNWMTNDDLFTHQLPRASRECKPWLLRWFPELERFGSDESLSVLDAAIKEHGPDIGCGAWLLSLGQTSSYDVPRIPRDDHEYIDPIQEAAEMAGTARVIAIIVDGD